MAGFFAGVGSFCPVFTFDKRCPGHPHICQRAKLKQNRTIGGRVMAAIQIISYGRRPPSWIMHQSVIRPFRTFWYPIVYVHTKFDENIFSGG